MKSCEYVINKFFINRLYLLLKYKSSIHNIAFSNEKNNLNQKRNMHGSSTVYKQKQSKTCMHLLTSQDIQLCGLLVDYCNALINSLSDGTHSLMIHLWVGEVLLHFFKSVPNEVTNSSVWPDWTGQCRTSSLLRVTTPSGSPWALKPWISYLNRISHVIYLVVQYGLCGKEISIADFTHK